MILLYNRILYKNYIKHNTYIRVFTKRAEVILDSDNLYRDESGIECYHLNVKVITISAQKCDVTKIVDELPTR